MAARYRTPKSVKGVYRGYVPIGLPQHRPPNRIKHWWKVLGKPMVTIYPKQNQHVGYSDQPEYPPLNDGSWLGCKKQVRLDWYDQLKALPTSEEKCYEIGRHISHKMAHIFNWMPRYNSLPMSQYLTHTHLVSSLPDKFTRASHSDSLFDRRNNAENFNNLKRAILDQIAFDKYNSQKHPPHYVSKIIRDGNRNAFISNQMIQNIVSIVKRSLAIERDPQLLSYQYDLSPAIRSWWYHSGFDPYNPNKIFYKVRMDEEGHVNQMIQLHGSTALNVRSNNFLEPVLSQDDPMVTDLTLVNKFSYSLGAYGARYTFKRPVSLPGFWFEERPKYDMPHTCFLSTDCLSQRASIPHKTNVLMDDHETCLNTQAILTGFGWLNSLAVYHGFTTFQELTYPFTCQLVTTDGQYWMFNVYQLNTHSFHRDFGPVSKNNICWSSGKMKLYEEYKDDEFVGVNDEVLELLLNFMSRKCSSDYTGSLNLRPYLSEDLRTDKEKEKTRADLRKLFENRGDFWLKKDWLVPLWEHVFFRHKETRYKITEMKPRWHTPKPKVPPIFD